MKRCKVCSARFQDGQVRCPLDGSDLTQLPDPLIGATIAGRYVIQEKIGAGGMGIVYRAKHEVVGRDVAIKFLSPDLAIDPTNRERFLREARAANRINHEHIIDITDFGQTAEGEVFLVMEYLYGHPLSEEIGRGPISVTRALVITLQMAQALARAHELDVIHRDIKPDNVYLLSGYDGDFIKILDFGLAQMKGELRLTATGTVFGTPEYMAPEQARGAPATHSVDLYAVGCVLFEMLTGRLPFIGNTPDLIIKHMREAPPVASSIRKSLPARIDALCTRLLQKKPEDRYLDAYALADELKQTLSEMGAPLRPSHLPSVGQKAILPGQVFMPPTNPPPPLSGPAAPSAKLGDATIVTQTVVTESAWEERVALFKELAKEAHPRGDAPGWLSPRLIDLEMRITKMKELRKQLDGLAGSASRHEDGMRDARLRIGRAIDELGRDESRVLRVIAEITPKLDEAKGRLSELEKPLLRAWGEISPMPIDKPAVTRDIAESLREAGHLAAIWLEAERSAATHRRDLSDRMREGDDLTFQIAQLKGRMGTVNAESDIDLNSLRDQTMKLDGQLREAVDSLVRDAEPVFRHFMNIPSVRDRMFGGAR